MRLFRFILLTIIMILARSVSAQLGPDQIEIIKGNKGSKYFHQNKLYTKEELGFVFKDEPQGFLEYEEAIKYSKIGKGFSLWG